MISEAKKKRIRRASILWIQTLPVTAQNRWSLKEKGKDPEHEAGRRTKVRLTGGGIACFVGSGRFISKPGLWESLPKKL